VNIGYYLISLLREDRIDIVNNNLKNHPYFNIYNSINGYDIEHTVKEFKRSNLKYKSLQFPTYGTLANALTKFNILKHQIEHNIEYMCFIEDDLELFVNFKDHVIKYCNILYENPHLNMIRLGGWGEGYITHINGASRIVDLIESQGIIHNIDMQLRLHCKPELVAIKTPWRLLTATNKGDCLKTKKIDINFLL